MSDRRTFEGKNLEEVLAAASNALGIDEPDLDYEILEQGRQGLLGIGAKNVRIRVMPPLKPISNELISGAADLGKPNDQLANPARDEARANRRNRRRRGGRGRPGGGRDQDDRVAPADRGDRDARGDRDEDPQASGDGERRGRRGRRRRGRRGGRRRSENRERRGGENENREPRPTPSEETTVAVRDAVGEMLGMCGLELEVQAEAVEGGIRMRLDGEDRDLVARRNGDFCNAFQFVLNRMARRTWPEAGRIKLAVEGQESMRDDELIALSREAADEVLETGRSKRLKPMNAYERRIVHVTIREMDGVGSRSEGNGSMKRVLVYAED